MTYGTKNGTFSRRVHVELSHDSLCRTILRMRGRRNKENNVSVEAKAAYETHTHVPNIMSCNMSSTQKEKLIGVTVN